MRRGMPINGFRRPELQAAHEVTQALSQIPDPYLRKLRNRLNDFQIYAALDFSKKKITKANPFYLRSSLSQYPAYFFFRSLNSGEEKSWMRVCRHFEYKTLRNFFNNSNLYIGKADTDEFGKKDNTFRLKEGLKQLEYVISIKSEVKQTLGGYAESKLRLLAERKEIGERAIEKYGLTDVSLEDAAFLYGIPSARELSRMFFEMPNFFVARDYCEVCYKELSNWLSITAGKGPVCGKHNYEMDLAGASAKQVTDYICKLIESKAETLSNGPLSRYSGIIDYRRTKMKFSLFDASNIDRFVFSDANISMTLLESENGAWRDYVAWRVSQEY